MIDTMMRAPRAIHIRPAGARLFPNLRELWAYRELVYFFVWRDVKVRYKQTFFGAAWAIIQPFVLMVVFSIFFGRLANIPTEGIPRPVFYFAALVPWTYLSQAVISSTNSLVANRGLITKIYFPRIIFPVAAVLPGLVDLAIALAILLLITVGSGIVPTVTVVYVIPLIVLTLATGLTAGLWLSTLNARYRDVGYAAAFVVQLWMFASPVVYPSSLVPVSWRWAYDLNPMATVIEGFRWALTGDGRGPGVHALGSVVLVVVASVAGLVFFRRSESSVVDLV